MKVYIVYQAADDIYYTDWLGVFSTREKAQAFIDYLRSIDKDDDHFNLFHPGIGIEEHILDELL